MKPAPPRFSPAACALGCALATLAAPVFADEKIELYAYVQSHNFDLRPLLPPKRGYAFFVDSSAFSGDEKVVVEAVGAAALPDVGKKERALGAYDRRGEWYQKNEERLASALGGDLPPGDYRFAVTWKDGRKAETVVRWSGEYLPPPTDIRVAETRTGYAITWKPPKAADSYLVFLVPAAATDVLKSLIQISHPNHAGARMMIRKGTIARGDYRIAVRVNRHLPEGQTGYIAESWGISQAVHHIE